MPTKLAKPQNLWLGCTHEVFIHKHSIHYWWGWRLLQSWKKIHWQKLQKKKKKNQKFLNSLTQNLSNEQDLICKTIPVRNQQMTNQTQSQICMVGVIEKQTMLATFMSTSYYSSERKELHRRKCLHNIRVQAGKHSRAFS